MDRKNLWHWLYWIAALLMVLGLQTWLAAGQTQLVGYDEFAQALRDGRLQDVLVTETHLSGHLKTPEEGKRELVTVRVEPELAAWLDGFHVPTGGCCKAACCATCCRGSCLRWCSSGCGGC